MTGTDTALILIDIQNDYFTGGKNPLVGAEAAVQVAKQVLDKAREKRHAIFHVQHVSLHPGATFFLPDTPGAEIHPLLTPREGETVVVKHSPSSFRETSLLADLQAREIKRLFLCGMMTHMCVDTTVRVAADLGFDCTLIGAATATKDLVYDGETVPARQVQAAFLSALQGAFAKVI